jgi:hypothetical protein
MDAQNGESRAGERGSLGGGAGVESGCGGQNLFGNIRLLGRIVQPPPRENPTPPLKFEPGQVPYTLDSRHPGSALSLRALYREPCDKPGREWPGGVPVLAKQIAVGAVYSEVKPYDDPYLHEGVGLDVSTRERLLNTVVYLQNKPDMCVVFGALSDDALPIWARASMQRLKKDQIDKRGRLHKATIIDVKKIWLAIDLDGLPLPLGVNTLRQQAEYARTRLPPEFRNAWCIVVATGTYGIDPKGVHLRFFFWLDKPLSCKEKTRWLDKTPFIDPSIYKSENQPIYTSAPTFLGDPLLDDPMFGISRVITLDGDVCVVTPHAERLKTPPRPPYHAPLRGTPSGDGGVMLSMACMAIRAMNDPLPDGDPPRPPRHEVIFEQCRLNVAPLVAIGAVDESYALLRVIRAAADIGKTDEDEIKRIFNDTLRHRREHMELESSDHRVFDENDEEIRS